MVFLVSFEKNDYSTDTCREKWAGRKAGPEILLLSAAAL